MCAATVTGAGCPAGSVTVTLLPATCTENGIDVGSENVPRQVPANFAAEAPEDGATTISASAESASRARPRPHARCPSSEAMTRSAQRSFSSYSSIASSSRNQWYAS